MDCPTDEELAAYLAGVSVPAVRTIAGHIEACSSCRHVLECMQSASVDAMRTHADLAAALDMSLASRRAFVGETLGRYRILSVVGAGAMGTVVRAWDGQLQREVAIKLLHGTSARGSASAEALRLEALASARLRHPNIVEIFDIQTDRGQPFLVMELVEGRSLRRWLEHARPLEEILRVLGEAGRGLAYAHEHSVSHGDFKPDNVIIGADDRARVFDFGLATVARAWTRRGAGTPAYMAPELVRGEPSTPATDQWAFAVVAYEALTGARPFVARTVEGLAARIGSAQGPEWTHACFRRPGLRPALERALSRDPIDRFESIDALLHALRSFASRPRRALWSVAIAASAVMVLAVSGSPDAPCTASSEPTWSRARSLALQDQLALAGQPEDRFELVADALSRYQSSFDRAVEQACRLREAEDSLHGDRIMDCLGRQRADAEAFVGALETGDETIVERAAVLAGSMPVPDHCLEQTDVPPPSRTLTAAEAREVRALEEELSRARLLTKVDRFEDGRARLLAVVARARELGHTPLLAEALVSVGDPEVSLGNARGARDLLEEGFYLASSVGADRIAFEAARSLAHLAMEVEQLPTAQEWIRHAESAIERLPPTSRPVADLWTLQGSFATRNGRPGVAREFHERALAHWRQAAGDHRYVIALEKGAIGYTYHNERAWPEARRWFGEAIEELVPVTSAKHPSVAAMYQAAAAVAYLDEDVERAIELGETALQIEVELSGDDAPVAAISRVNLGAMYKDVGRMDVAMGHLSRGLDTIERHFGSDSARAFAPNYNLGLVEIQLGETAAARRHFVAALEIARAAYGEDHERYALALQEVEALASADADRGMP